MAKPKEAEFSWANKIKDGIRSRVKRRANKNLGIIDITKEHDVSVFRDPKLETLDSYFESRQYDHLQKWDDALKSEDYVAIRQRKPRIIYPFAKNLSERLTSKLIGESVFPKMLIKDSPDDQEFIGAILRESNLKSALSDPIKRVLATGSAFLRFWIVEGKYKFEWYKSKYCYPEFQENGELESVTVEYVYVDENETDDLGDPKKKWYKLELTTESEILYDNPPYERGVEPNFQEVSRVDHDMGFVQGAWLKANVSETGFIDDVKDFIDEFNYSLSQSSQAVSYNQDPQLVLNNMDEEEISTLIRSATKHWNLGREGKAEFKEAGLQGVERAMDLRTKVGQNISDITRIVILDPEKIVGNAQSAKAMEVLHGPLKDAVDELRLFMGPQIKDLLIKMAVATLAASKMGILSPIMLPPGYAPMSLDITIKWPALFQQTLEDLQKKVSIAVSAAAGRLISERTGTAFVAEDFGIEDVDAERAEILAQPPPPNPFGGF